MKPSFYLSLSSHFRNEHFQFSAFLQTLRAILKENFFYSFNLNVGTFMAWFYGRWYRTWDTSLANLSASFWIRKASVSLLLIPQLFVDRLKKQILSLLVLKKDLGTFTQTAVHTIWLIRDCIISDSMHVRALLDKRREIYIQGKKNPQYIKKKLSITWFSIHEFHFCKSFVSCSLK